MNPALIILAIGIGLALAVVGVRVTRLLVEAPGRTLVLWALLAPFVLVYFLTIWPFLMLGRAIVYPFRRHHHHRHWL